jgi:predicted CXXCH cytochrome family protein
VKENPQIKIKSPGVPTVPVGQIVYLKADASGGEITGYRWWLESPAESNADLSASTVSNPTLVPDLEGQYKVKVSVTFGAGKTEEASLWLSAGSFVGDGLVVKSGSEAQCINCHEEEVKNWKVILNKQESAAPYKDETGITCATCHEPHDASNKENLLRAGKAENVCIGCHDLVVMDDESEFLPHVQGSVVKGNAGQTIGNKDLIFAGKHSQIEKGCIGCHMMKSPGVQAGSPGGHTFMVISHDDKNPILNTNACVRCHQSINLEYVRNYQNKTKKLLETLANLLPLNELQSRASYNYYTIYKDGTFGIHNPIYSKKLLEISIEALKNQQAKKNNQEKKRK